MNCKFELPDVLYSVSNIMKKHETLTDKSPIKIYIRNTAFKTKTRYHHELLILETIKLLRCTENRITKGEILIM